MQLRTFGYGKGKLSINVGNRALTSAYYNNWAKAAPTYMKRLANSKVNLFPINFLSLVIINATLLGCRIDYPVQKDG